MEPWQSWAAAVVVGGGLFYYYSHGSKPQIKATRTAQLQEQPQTTTAKRRPVKSKSQVEAKQVVQKVAESANSIATTAINTAQSAVNDVRNGTKKRKAGKEAVVAQHSKQVTASTTDDVVEDDDKDWAAQLNAMKQGISLHKPDVTSKITARQQSSNTQAAAPEQKSSIDYVKSLAAGAAVSGGAGNGTTPRAGGDVSDMLEQRAAAPTVLRIVGEEKPKKQHAPRTAEPQETKKQRQNKRKVEEQRAEREVHEKQRQVLLEQQRRVAREARGEPAKNGLAQTRAPAVSAWASNGSPATSGAGVSAAAPSTSLGSGIQLLDTFEPDVASTSSSYDMSNGTSSATVSSINDQDIPSEEAQMEILHEMNGWNEVSKSKKGKKKTSGDAGEIIGPGNKSEPASAPSTSSSNYTKPTKTTIKSQQPPITNSYATLLEPVQKGHPDDSDWL